MIKHCEHNRSFRKAPEVVVVDDDATFLMFLGRLLAKSGFEQTWLFDDPKEASLFLSRNRTDVLITDYKMPEVTGLDLIRTHAHIPTRVVMSGSPRPPEGDQVHWLTKPFPFAALLRLLEESPSQIRKSILPSQSFRE